MGPFLLALRREVTFRSPVFRGAPVDSLYLGGGTPTLLGTGQLKDLVSFFQEQAFLSPNCEITVEANPGTVNPEKLKTLNEAGVNRLSLGVQALQDRALRRIGRGHTRKDILNAIRWAREAGFDNLSLDLMFGLPEQTPGEWERTLQETFTFSPEHISAYQLTVEKNTEFEQLTQSGKLRTPGEDLVEEMHRITPPLMTRAGYHRYEISNYVRDRRNYCHHNVNTWNYGEYLGFGPGAVSFRSGVRSKNTEGVEDYIDRVNHGRPLACEREEIQGRTELAEMFMLGLRMREGIDLRAVERRTRVKVREVYSGLFSDLQDQGLLHRDRDRLRLTDKGVLFSNEVFMAFM